MSLGSKFFVAILFASSVVAPSVSARDYDTIDYVTYAQAQRDARAERRRQAAAERREAQARRHRDQAEERRQATAERRRDKSQHRKPAISQNDENPLNVDLGEAVLIEHITADSSR